MEAPHITIPAEIVASIAMSAKGITSSVERTLPNLKAVRLSYWEGAPQLDVWATNRYAALHLAIDIDPQPVSVTSCISMETLNACVTFAKLMGDTPLLLSDEACQPEGGSSYELRHDQLPDIARLFANGGEPSGVQAEAQLNLGLLSKVSSGIRLPREDAGPSRNAPWKVTQKPFEKASRGGGVFRFYRTSQARKDQHRTDYAEIWQMPIVTYDA